MVEGAGYSASPSSSQIVPVVTGSSPAVMALSGALEERSISAVAVRPPTVPEGTARIRFSVTRNHSREQLLEVAEALAAFSKGAQ